MHASLEDLLSVRDGNADAAVRDHLATCGECRGELARLQQLRARMQALPALDPPEDRWPRVQRRLAERRFRRGGPLLAGLAAAASLVLAVAMVLRMDATVPVHAPDSLVDRSQQLERELRAMPGESLMSGAEAELIAEIEDRIALVDLQLASGATTPVESEYLWQRRVDLLMDLMAVRSEESYVAYEDSYLL